MRCDHVCRACGTIFANGQESELQRRLDAAMALVGTLETVLSERDVWRHEAQRAFAERDAAVEESRRLAELAMEAR